jgi:hypothetical protein
LKKFKFDFTGLSNDDYAVGPFIRRHRKTLRSISFDAEDFFEEDSNTLGLLDDLLEPKGLQWLSLLVNDYPMALDP